MDIADEIEKLYQELLDVNASVTTAMNRYYLILRHIDVGVEKDELEWVRKETSVQIVAPGLTPSYRKLRAWTEAEMWNVSAATWSLKSIDYGELTHRPDVCKNNQYLLGASVNEIEDLLKRSTEKVVLHQYKDFTVPSFASFKNDRYRNVQVVCDRSEIIRLLQSVREHVLKALTDLRLTHSEFVKKGEIMGGVQLIVTGDNNQITVGAKNVKQSMSQGPKQKDWPRLQKELLQLGISADDCDRLKDALDIEPVVPEVCSDKRPKFGPKVAAWVGDILSKVVQGIYTIELSTAANVIGTLITKYYVGW